MSKLSRTKGANFERITARLLRDTLGVAAERNLVETREGNDSDIVTELPWAIQCKTGALPPLWKALEQAVEDGTKKDTMPIVFAHRDAAAPGEKAIDVVVLRTEDFLRIARAARRAERLGDPFLESLLYGDEP